MAHYYVGQLAPCWSHAAPGSNTQSATVLSTPTRPAGFPSYLQLKASGAKRPSGGDTRWLLKKKKKKARAQM